MNTTLHPQMKAPTKPSFTPVQTGLLQRKCACGGAPGVAGECTECSKSRLSLQRSTRISEPGTRDWRNAQRVADEVPRAPSQPLDPATRDFIEPRLGHDFSRVTVNPVLSRTVHTKLTISQPGDAFEREADRVAEEVMSLPQATDVGGTATLGAPPTISRWVGQRDANHIGRQSAEDEQADAAASPEEEFDESNLLSLKEADGSSHAPSPGVAAQIQSMRGSGQPLAPNLRDFFEPRFQRDFSQVRVHTGSRAAQTTQALNARAYTLGRDIAIAPSEYQPETSAGRLLLAHELTHVVQQADQVQTVMRACDCPAMGASPATSSQDAKLRGAFPRLQSGDYCVTGAATPTYNCFAWSMRDTSRWLQSEVDSFYGNNNGTLELSDFDDMYANEGLKPVTNATPSNPEVVLYAKGSTPTHAARNTGAGCGGFESKLGQYVRIAHYPYQLEGGSVYGDINRYYVPM